MTNFGLCFFMLVTLFGSFVLAAENLPGDIAYERHHHVWAMEGGNNRKRIKTSNYLKIKKISFEKIKFCVDTTSDYAHMCNISGEAILNNNHNYVYRSGASIDECVLELEQTNSAWIFHDRTGFCTKQFCGKGISIDLATFSLSEKTNSIRPCLTE